VGFRISAIGFGSLGERFMVYHSEHLGCVIQDVQGSEAKE
jgi:hypothetical protein